MLRILVEPIVRPLSSRISAAPATSPPTPSCRPMRASTPSLRRASPVVAGLEAGLLAFELLDPSLRIEILRPDGSRVERGQEVARISGRARPVLAAERTALN